ncbi:type I restriction-modification system subunit M N-terminal domain-containing protein [Pelagirhabdus alkalitolerans]|uniref:type I restriction-modification system subunit M N-terminal domain-containing protein n=1 Tax=Pelagirhabdus alkalitolerans TaxID=1612202 RepID=UPI001FE1182F|nr:type I restriction-modification system subunit M N-terminal domain-containing protein [Pelagirhabdus alkalitolerans]
MANILRGLYKPHEYGKVILPMTVIKPLMLTREEVLKAAKQTKWMNATIHTTLKRKINARMVNMA